MYAFERSATCAAIIDFTHIYLSQGKYILIKLNNFLNFECKVMKNNLNAWPTFPYIFVGKTLVSECVLGGLRRIDS